MNIRLFAPYLGEDELNEIKKSFDKSWVGLGEKVVRFEKDFEKYLGCKKCIGVNSATAALHLAVSAFRFPKGSKVLVPAITFASTAFAPIYNGLEPVFVDVNKDDITLDLNDLEKKYDEKCMAIMPVHYGGQPAKMDLISEFAKAKNLKIIEDCAHTIGAEYKGRKLGLWGDIGCFSFEEKKAMTTGDGGMLASNDEELISPLASTRWLGIDKDTWKRNAAYTSQEEIDTKHWYYDITALGFKYNMNDLSAAIGLIQLKKLDMMNKRRAEIIKRYLNGLNKNIFRPLLPYEPDKNNYWVFGIRYKNRDNLIKYLKSKGIATGVHYIPLHQLSFFKQYENECRTADRIWEEFITLPLHYQLTNEEVDYILEMLRNYTE